MATRKEIPDLTSITNAQINVADEIIISDTSALQDKRMSFTELDARFAGASALEWTAFTPVISGGGTLTSTTANARFVIDGKILYMQFDFTQTNAGNGTDDITVDVPGSATVLDAINCGVWSGDDIGNDNVFSVHTITSINSTNKFKVRRTGSTTFFRGGTFIGNNGKVSGINITVGIA